MWLGWFGLLGWSGWYYVLELVRVAGKVWLGWLWQSGSSRWSGRTGKSKGQGVLDSLLASFSSLKSQFVLSFQKIFWPRRPPWLWVDLGLFLCQNFFCTTLFSTTLDFFEFLWKFVKLLKFCEIFEILYPILKLCETFETFKIFESLYSVSKLCKIFVHCVQFIWEN